MGFKPQQLAARQAKTFTTELPGLEIKWTDPNIYGMVYTSSGFGSGVKIATVKMIKSLKIYCIHFTSATVVKMH